MDVGRAPAGGHHATAWLNLDAIQVIVAWYRCYCSLFVSRCHALSLKKKKHASQNASRAASSAVQGRTCQDDW